ncbi:hypothetical protein EDS67_14865 [candidate division KSB1 bacterium]|nr:MAG: hypothetical protein EDS67_14865 [candidate division KSB1 bacterium]MCE7940945.1 hypothetical protein [Chlorobi bacterium CHB1]
MFALCGSLTRRSRYWYEYFVLSFRKNPVKFGGRVEFSQDSYRTTNARRCGFQAYRTSIVLSLALASPAIAQEHISENLLLSLSSRQFQFAASSDTIRVALPDSFIIAQSETLRCGEYIFARGTDYHIDYGRAIITWFGNRTDCDSLILNYRVLPLRLPTRLSLFQLQPLPQDSLPAAKLELESLVSPAQSTRRGFAQNRGANLVKRGSLTRGLSVGTNQALTVDSGLRMQIAGEIADGVEVIAALTDQNTPIQPEGNTQTLQEIDKVSVQLKSPTFNATLGDFEIAYDGSEFARYSRKLQGARLAVGRSPVNAPAGATNFHFTASGAVSKGQYTTNQFNGIEGNQGPYQLRGDRGQIDIIVLAGTERVWIDGEPMTRGENNDYVIEYANGQITFTRNRLITADSRITIDFQYSDERFRRSLYSAQGALSALGDKVKWQTTLLREGDNKDNPLSFTLGEAEQFALSQAGDQLAFRDGAVPVTPPARGSYIRIDSTVMFYRYVGSDSGNYNVSFSDVGDGRGAYRFRSFGNYEFVGENRGRYLPVILLTPAQRHDVVDNRLLLQPWRGVSLINELALSNLDQNLYSSLDDGDNQGHAWLTALQIEQRPLQFGKTNLGQIALQLQYRSKDARYRDIDRSDVVEFNRKWNLANSAAISDEDLLESLVTYIPVTGWRWQGSLGSLSRGRSQSSSRWEINTSLRRKSWPELNYRIENIAREETPADSLQNFLAMDSDWLRQRGNASWKIGRFTPLAGYEAEDRKEIFADSLGGFRFRSVTGGMAVALSRHLSAQASLNERNDDTRTLQGLRPASTSRTQTYGLDLKQWKALALNLNVTHRERTFADATTPATRSDLADLRLGLTPFRRALNADVHYQITNTQASQQQRVYFKVEQGRGNYRFDPEQNEYIPDPLFGDYVLRLVNTEQFIPVAEVRLRSNIRLTFKELLQPWAQQNGESKPSRPSWWKSYLTPISLNTFLRLEEKTKYPEVWEIYRLNLSHFLDDSLTIFGTQSLQQEIYLWENRREQSVRYRLTALRERNNQFLDEGLRRTQMQHELRLTWALSPKVTSQTELKLNREDRVFDSAGRNDRLVRSKQAEIELSYRPRPALEVANRAGAAFDRDLHETADRPSLRAQALFLRPRVAYALRGKGRMQGEIEWVSVSAEPAGQVLPYELAKGNREGTTWRWNFSVEYRVSSNVNFSATYLGRREPDRPQTLHLGKVEMRAFF